MVINNKGNLANPIAFKSAEDELIIFWKSTLLEFNLSNDNPVFFNSCNLAIFLSIILYFSGEHTFTS